MEDIRDYTYEHELETFRSTHITPGFCPISINREEIFTSTVIHMKRGQLDIKIKLEIKFIGEDGLDASGPRREYFCSLMKAICDGETMYAFLKVTRTESYPYMTKT